MLLLARDYTTMCEKRYYYYCYYYYSPQVCGVGLKDDASVATQLNTDWTWVVISGEASTFLNKELQNISRTICLGLSSHSTHPTTSTTHQPLSTASIHIIVTATATPKNHKYRVVRRQRRQRHGLVYSPTIQPRQPRERAEIVKRHLYWNCIQLLLSTAAVAVSLSVGDLLNVISNH